MIRPLLLFFILLTLVAFRSYGDDSKIAQTEISRDLPESNLTASPLQELYGFRLEPYQPSGVQHLADQASYDLANTGSTVMPGLFFGILAPGNDIFGLQTYYGLDLFGEGTIQNAGFAASDSSAIQGAMQTTLEALQASFRVRWHTQRPIFTRVRAELGSEQIRFSANGNYASFYHSASFYGYALGMEWDPFQNFGITADYAQRVGLASVDGWTPGGATVQIGFFRFIE